MEREKYAYYEGVQYFYSFPGLECKVKLNKIGVELHTNPLFDHRLCQLGSRIAQRASLQWQCPRTVLIMRSFQTGSEKCWNLE